MGDRMRMSAPVAVAAVIAAGVAVPSSAAGGADSVPSGGPPEAVAASRDDENQARMVGLLPVAAPPPRMLRSVQPAAADAGVGAVQRYEVALPVSDGALGIPEIVLAAYRNAELALASSAPGCGLSWFLLAGIGRIESGHAAGGRVDSGGTTVQPIFGPALDGTLPGNEVIPAAGGGYVRAIGPMQFLPETWEKYAADGNGDGAADPHNVFDATLAAGRYLCSGGLDLRDPVQETRAILRYNNSRAYAADVLSWSAAYRSGGAPVPAVDVAPIPLPPPDPATTLPTIQVAPMPGPLQLEPMTSVSIPHRPTPPLLTVPGLPPIDCGLLCAGPPENPGPADQPPPPAPAEPATPPVDEPAPEPPAPHVPSITLPFGIVVPLPASPT
ncbi:lytic transglycosylase domain-containing protein [Nocardia cyriacigeorgica]|uniref:lytic transglycosylase domain-containing protein n=1 Tax=Nocardia cyriacigeorgica TaxID=135487 RepID=UPI002456B316|nr:lytic murein transglycosylase [Nocardia cyriacigeorgica]